MYKKLFILFLFIFGLCWLDACCGDSKPFFDYKSLAITSDLLARTAQQDTVVVLKVAPDELEYLASIYQLTVSTPAYGTSCPQPGEDGTKYKMTSVEILADKDFNDTLPAGKSLSSLFYNGRSTNPNPPPITKNVSELEFPYEGWEFVVFTPFKPTQAGQTFALTVKVTKSDGSVAQGTVNGVKFGL